MADQHHRFYSQEQQQRVAAPDYPLKPMSQNESVQPSRGLPSSHFLSGPPLQEDMYQHEESRNTMVNQPADLNLARFTFSNMLGQTLSGESGSLQNTMPQFTLGETHQLQSPEPVPALFANQFSPYSAY